MILVALESPYAGDVEKHLRYARAAMADCIHRGEAPFASHLLYPQAGILDDEVYSERELGITAGFLWAACARYRVVYCDLGVSAGMRRGIEHATSLRQPVAYRYLKGWS